MKVTVTVLSPELIPLGLVNQFTSMIWTSRTKTFSSFQIWCPLTEENSKLLKRGNLVWTGGDSLAEIESVQNSTDETGSMSIQVSGRTVESWLERRLVLGQYSSKSTLPNHLRNLVNLNAVNPLDSNRVIPFLYLSDDQEDFGEAIAFSTYCSNLATTLFELSAMGRQLFFRVLANVPEKSLTFRVYKGADRSVEQTERPSVVLSTELSDILTDTYRCDSTSWFNSALVKGVESGNDRRTAVVNGGLKGLNRRELYVDAGDILDYEEWPTTVSVTTTVIDKETGEAEVRTVTTAQDPKTGETRVSYSSETVFDTSLENGTEVSTTTSKVPIPDSEYRELLKGRGLSTLSEHPLVESFDAEIRTFGARAYEYGVDYFLGDRVTVQDKNLQLQVSTEITEVEQTWDESGYSVSISFGDTAPTITQLLKRKE